ncbi:TIR domain-containing protein [uncultured Alistipes sp.]|uniref:TIR domain-containing protein n=1 Tax=Alistipes ihumii TaxID=1470347 RepID=UPI00259995C9|nr:TIR domain-containing protein [uncultured Alistipes sp.]
MKQTINNMGHKCYISFKAEDKTYKAVIQSWANKDKVDMIDKSLNTPIDSDNEDYIMRKIREDYLSDSTVTIFLIGQYSSESRGWEEQKYIKRELQASLYNGRGNTRNGILGVVLPQMYSTIYKGTESCVVCKGSHNIIDINDSTVIKEFGRNYYLNNHGKCAYSEEDRYCVLVKWEDFATAPNVYIEKAFNKRGQPIADDVIVYPK